MIEIAIAVVIMLLGAGGYQALASVDFKPIRINIDRRPKVIENNTYNNNDWYKKYREECTAHDKTKENWQKTRVELRAIESRKPKQIDYNKFETGAGEIVYRPTITASNYSAKLFVDLYQSQYLDRIEKPPVKKRKPMYECIWCLGDHYALNCPIKWDIMK